MEKGSHATRQGTLVHLRLSSLGHGGLTPDLKEQDWRARAELYLKRFFSKEKEKKQQQKSRQINRRTFHHNPRRRAKCHHQVSQVLNKYVDE